MVICIPSGITEVEKRAVYDSTQRVNARDVYLIHEPMAAAIGMGIDVQQPKGNIIIDIGGGTTEIAVIALGGIVCDTSIKVAGDIFTSDIAYYMRTQHNLFVGERTAETIKIQVGSAVEQLDNPPDDMAVQGRDLLTGKPKEVKISYKEIAHALDKSVLRVEDAVMQALSQTPPSWPPTSTRRGSIWQGEVRCCADWTKGFPERRISRCMWLKTRCVPWYAGRASC